MRELRAGNRASRVTVVVLGGLLVALAGAPAATAKNADHYYVGQAKGKSNSTVAAYVRGNEVRQFVYSARSRCYEYGRRAGSGKPATELRRARIDKDRRFRKVFKRSFGDDKRQRIRAVARGKAAKKAIRGSARQRYSSPIPGGGLRVCKTGLLEFRIGRATKATYERRVEALGIDARS